MTLLGIDTGGTFTDAVLYDELSRSVVATAKSPTTHDDLSVGINGAVDAVLAASGIAPESIELVSLSTTLATNALVEGRGRSIGLVLIGFEPAAVERAGLTAALAGDPVIAIAGGHDAHGDEVAPVDLDRLRAGIRSLAGRTVSGAPIEGWAVAAQFSVRNPAHERAGRDVVRDLTGSPVSCSHELSAQLNGPKRAVTAVLNARLIPIVDQLVATVTATLTSRGITAPVMVVRGDGSLVSAAFVRERPIETILSGPAASLVGAAHLTGLDDAVISDIGGTTTDIAVLRHGRPVVSNDGATVGGHHTMVRAVAMRTHGLGGDSEVIVSPRASGPKLLIGPRRVIPLSSLAVEHHECVTKALRSQLAASNPSELAGVMLVPAASFREWVPQSAPERELRLALADGPTPAMSLGVAASKRSLIDRLVRQGLLMRSSFTPTDACHVLGLDDQFDRAIARLAAEVFARHRDALGRAIAADAEGVAEMVVETLVRRSAEAVLAAAFVDDGLSADLASSELLSRSFDRATGSVRAEIGLRAPLVGLGASAATYYPRVAALARTSAVIPIHAHVANAVGAVVGRVTITRTASVQSPAEGVFVTHLGDNPTAHTSVDAARIAAESRLRSDVAEQMRAAGAGDFEVSVEWDERAVDLSGLTMFVEGTLTVTASGRPDLTAVAVRTA